MTAEMEVAMRRIVPPVRLQFGLLAKLTNSNVQTSVVFPCKWDSLLS